AENLQLKAALIRERSAHSDTQSFYYRAVKGKGILTRAEFASIVKCLHPDLAPPDRKKQFEKAQALFNLCIEFIKRKERPTEEEFVSIKPGSAEELDLLRRATKAARKAKRTAKGAPQSQAKQKQ